MVVDEKITTSSSGCATTTTTTTTTEETPLLWKSRQDDEETGGAAVISKDDVDVWPVQVLAEFVGATNLALPNQQHRIIETYGVAQFGTKTIHQTKPVILSKGGGNQEGGAAITGNEKNPIWTIKESSLFLININANDVRNNKTLTITLWGRRRKASAGFVFLGKTRIKSSNIILNYCTEERVEMDLVDELERKMMSTSSGDSSKLALRFRIASKGDAVFVQAWNEATKSKIHTITRSILKDSGILCPHYEKRKKATLVTEMNESDVPGARLHTAATLSIQQKSKPQKRTPGQLYHVKPFPDPDALDTTKTMTADELKEASMLPSREWIVLGSGDLGQVYVEVISCRNLPNVDYGAAAGNQTDAFVCLVYGDSVAQTNIIDDELSPIWPPWSQRAFCFSIMHPSHIMYLAVFGYKRRVFRHAPIGRVEINLLNFQSNGAEYILEYDLFKNSHAINRKASGTVKIRLRLERFNERTNLLASLKIPPAIYVNVQKKKSLYVIRYTASGEYDSEEKFHLSVLLAYVDELKDRILRRILYSLNDGTKSVVFWRDQVQIGRVWMPLHSLALFCAGMYAVEHPHVIPAFLFLGGAYLMLVNLQLRSQSPSPWYRSFSFTHYLSILIRGQSTKNIKDIEEGEGWEDQMKIEEERRKRAEDDDRLFQMKEAAEKIVEKVENISLQTESKSVLVSLELLEVLGKIQGLVGNFVRLCRAVDVVVTWEESDVAFWITTALLGIGFLFLLIPWVFLLRWTSRLAILILLGPQNKLIDIFFVRKQSDERTRLQQMMKERMFRARCRQEEANKLKAFRQVLFGKFSALVPNIMWTPQIDHPGRGSTVRLSKQKFECNEESQYNNGQKLYGNMILRPYNEFANNAEESKMKHHALLSTNMSGFDENPQKTDLSPPSSVEGAGTEEGVEVSDFYDIETGQPKAKQMPRNEESIQGDLGIEVTDMYEHEARFAEKSWRGASQQLTDEEKEMSMKGYRSETNATDSDLASNRCFNDIESAQPKVKRMPYKEESIHADLGVEVTDMYEDEAEFAEKSWRGVSQQFTDEAQQTSFERRRSETKATNPTMALVKKMFRRPTSNKNDAKNQGELAIRAQRSQSDEELGFKAVDTFDGEASSSESILFESKAKTSILVSNESALQPSTADAADYPEERAMSAKRSESCKELPLEIAAAFDDEAGSSKGILRGTDEKTSIVVSNESAFQSSKPNADDYPGARVMSAQRSKSGRELGFETVDTYDDEAGSSRSILCQTEEKNPVVVSNQSAIQSSKPIADVYPGVRAIPAHRSKSGKELGFETVDTFDDDVGSSKVIFCKTQKKSSFVVSNESALQSSKQTTNNYPGVLTMSAQRRQSDKELSFDVVDNFDDEAGLTQIILYETEEKSSTMVLNDSAFQSSKPITNDYPGVRAMTAQRSKSGNELGFETVDIFDDEALPAPRSQSCKELGYEAKDTFDDVGGTCESILCETEKKNSLVVSNESALQSSKPIKADFQGVRARSAKHSQIVKELRFATADTFDHEAGSSKSSEIIICDTKETTSTMISNKTANLSSIPIADDFPGVRAISAQRSQSGRELGFETVGTFDVEANSSGSILRENEEKTSAAVSNKISFQSSASDWDSNYNKNKANEVLTVKAEKGASVRELGFEVVPFDL